MRQDLYPLAADALGRVMVCTMLMAGGLKDRETFQLTFSGNGPLGGVVAISDGEGGVRGYVTNGKVSPCRTCSGRVPGFFFFVSSCSARQRRWCKMLWCRRLRALGPRRRR